MLSCQGLGGKVEGAVVQGESGKAALQRAVGQELEPPKAF